MTAEMFRYTADINLSSPNDPHAMAVGRVHAKSDVLDLGTADGSVASVLTRMGCKVWGVEIDQQAAEKARAICQEVAVADLNQIDLPSQFGGRDFDIVLMLDVLEHLLDPVSTLSSVKQVLRPMGWAVISLPNVAHISVRLALLNGRFTYTDLGLLDRTHLHFFTLEGVTDLLQRSGWRCFDLARVIRDLGTTEITVEWPDPRLVEDLKRDPEALTYQFVLMAAPEGSPVLSNPPLLPAAIAQRALLEATRLSQVAEFWAELEKMRSASLTRRDHLKYLVSSLRENSQRIADTLAEIGDGIHRS
jgi:2-polyprenyl-3-methyl-5-hydroxy-6-metoxy-1,4-benzoquinol methylase